MISPNVPACTNTWRGRSRLRNALALEIEARALSEAREGAEKHVLRPASRAAAWAAVISVVAFPGSSTRITAISFTWPSRDASMSEIPARRKSRLSVLCTTTGRITTRVCPAASDGRGATAHRAATESASFQRYNGTSPGGVADTRNGLVVGFSIIRGWRGQADERAERAYPPAGILTRKRDPSPSWLATSNRSAVVGDDAMTNHETKAGPLIGILCRKEGIEDSLEVFRGDPGAGVADLEHRLTPFLALLFDVLTTTRPPGFVAWIAFMTRLSRT